MSTGKAQDALISSYVDHVAAMLAFTAGAASRAGLTMSELAALEHLSFAQLTARELGERLSLSSGAVTALVDRLSASGHVRRQPNPADRRSSLITITIAGEELGRAQLAPVAEGLAELVKAMPAADRAVVSTFLRHMASVLAGTTASADHRSRPTPAR